MFKFFPPITKNDMKYLEELEMSSTWNKIELLQSYSQIKLNFISLKFHCFELSYHTVPYRTIPFTETVFWLAPPATPWENNIFFNIFTFH